MRYNKCSHLALEAEIHFECNRPEDQCRCQSICPLKCLKLYDKGKFFYLEMTARIQVEQPDSEIRGGNDIDKEQIQIASK